MERDYCSICGGIPTETEPCFCGDCATGPIEIPPPLPNVFAVTVPTSYTDTIDFFIGGPTFDENDYCVVVAKNRRDAKVQAVRAFRKMKSSALVPGENPFYGMKVHDCCAEEAEDAKKSGCFFDFTQPEGETP